jgi:hypothetical protein
MKSFWYFLTVYIFFSLQCIGQNEDFNFFVEKVKTNYPGFSDKTSPVKFRDFALKVLRQNPKDTFRAMSIIVNSFNDKHLQISQTKESIKLDRNDCRKNFLAVTKYFTAKGNRKKYEGYWLNDYNDCVVALQQVNASPLTYKAYVVESNDSLLPQGRILGVYEFIKDKTFLTDAISTYSKKRYFVATVFRNDSVFTTGAEGKWKRLRSYTKPILTKLPQFNYYTSAQVFDDNTYIIKIPGATQKDGQIIDSIVSADYNKIARSKTLIIDLTNNLGGKSNVYAPLWPFIYTNPIARHQTSTYCTNDNIHQLEQAVDEYKKSPNSDSTALKQMNDWIKILRDNLGKFVLNGADTIKLDSIYATPKNVGIIINYAGQSATELMLFMAKQSSKVKLFGEHTMGAADYLDYSPTYLPSKRYKLYIATSKRVITKDGPKIDGVGIYPNIPIPDKVQNWQKFVVEYYEEH